MIALTSHIRAPESQMNRFMWLMNRFK